MSWCRLVLRLEAIALTAVSAGTPAADIIITNQATVYYRLISQSGERQTYLGDAEMETLLVYPTEAAATAAFDTINADSALWADEVGNPFLPLSIQAAWLG